MTFRFLTPATIIPAHLYVERSADRQLKSVIDDMGRPAYVLVARQMGKTNLLLNMKRNRNSDIVVYFDLSNRFENARKFFRNIIDTIIENHPHIFDVTIEKINKQRLENDLEANVEYDRHLRILLNTCQKKIVLIFDEIDSLIGCSYSDSILAQIRSMYFSRGNYDIYNQLTYVLSGVAEPGDLIKDKNISPFNIGEKIYLEDFTKNEFDEFIKRSNLAVDTIVIDRIFWWTNGNPRISWDICSEIEMEILAGNTATPLLVDNIVERLYYQEYDRAPVDHIRTLVEFDSSIRNAIVSIRYGRGEFIDSRVKSKLYLAGITKSDKKHGVIIKNKVIDGVLSDDWIKQLENNHESSLTIASDAYANKDYSKAITYFLNVLQSDKENLPEVKRIELAFSYFYNGDYKNAIEHFEYIEKTTSDDTLRQMSSLQSGILYINNDSHQKSLEKLTLAALGTDLALQINAKLNLQVVYTKLKKPELASTAISLSRELISQINEINEPDQNYLLATALANSSLIHSFYGYRDESINDLNQAMLISPLELKPFLLIEGFKRATEPSHRTNLLLEFISLITNNSLELNFDKNSPLNLNKQLICLSIAGLITYTSDKQINDFMTVVKNKYYNSAASMIHIFNDLAESVMDSDDKQSGITLLQYAERKYLSGECSNTDKITLYRQLAHAQEGYIDNIWGMKFLRTLNEIGLPETLSEEDTSLAIGFIVSSFSAKSPERNEVINLWDKFEHTASEKWPQWNAIYQYIRMKYAIERNNFSDAYQYAIKITSVSDEHKLKDEAIEFLTHLKKEANEILNTLKEKELRSLKRNEKILVKYGNAEPSTVKFKSVESDLRSGKCTFIKRI